MNKKINYFGRVTIEYITEDTINIILKIRDSDVILLNSIVKLKHSDKVEDIRGLFYSDIILLHKLFGAIGMLINNNKLANTPEYQFHSVELIHYAGCQHVDNLKNLLVGFTFMDNILARHDSFALNFNIPLKEEMFEDNTLKINTKSNDMCIGVDNEELIDNQEVNEIKLTHPSEYSGVVISVDKKDGNVDVVGLDNQEPGQLVEFNNGVQGMILNVCPTYGNIKVIIFQEDINITKTSRCKNLNRKLEFPLGELPKRE